VPQQSDAADSLHPLPLKEPEQFEHNDLAGEVFESGHAAEILSEHSLKFMLPAGVCTLLGSDGGGVEHSDMRSEYQLAGELIEFCKKHDHHFPREISIRSLYENVEKHLEDMKTDKACE
jgi:hypothetical protein